MPPAPTSITRGAGFDVSSPSGKNTTGEGSEADDAEVSHEQYSLAHALH